MDIVNLFMGYVTYANFMVLINGTPLLFLVVTFTVSFGSGRSGLVNRKFHKKRKIITECFRSI